MRKVLAHVAVGAGLTLSTFALSSSAEAQHGHQRESCNNWKSDDERIAGCTRLIDSGRESPEDLAIDHQHRGSAYKSKYLSSYRDPHRSEYFDRAISDFSESVRLNPKKAEVFYLRGELYGIKENRDKAISDFSSAIALDGKMAIYYWSRGSFYSLAHEADRAIADYSNAIQLYRQAPVRAYKLSFWLDRRAELYRWTGEYDRAIADYTEALVAVPEDYRDHKVARDDVINWELADLHLRRGLVRMYAGNLAEAVSDLDEASNLSLATHGGANEYVYPALVRETAGKRINLPSRLLERLAAGKDKIDVRKWPAPIIRLYLGQTTSEAVLAAADSSVHSTAGDFTSRNERVCDATFFVGEQALQRGDKVTAERLFQLTVAQCKDVGGYFPPLAAWAANAELLALSATVSPDSSPSARSNSEVKLSSPQAVAHPAPAR